MCPVERGGGIPFAQHRKDKMIIVDFYAPWCHWCKLLDPVPTRAFGELFRTYAYPAPYPEGSPGSAKRRRLKPRLKPSPTFF